MLDIRMYTSECRQDCSCLPVLMWSHLVAPTPRGLIHNTIRVGYDYSILRSELQWVIPTNYTLHALDPLHHAVKRWSTSNEFATMCHSMPLCATLCHYVPLCATMCQTQVFLEDFSAPGGGGGSLGAKNTNALTIMLRFHVFTFHKLHFTFCNTLHINA